MGPIETRIVNRNFEKVANPLKHLRGAPKYLKSLLSIEALRQAKNIGLSYPSQIVEGAKDLYRLGAASGLTNIKDRLVAINVANPRGAPIAFIAPKIAIPAAIGALGLRGDSDKKSEVPEKI
jgi:hypothetical protein